MKCMALILCVFLSACSTINTSREVVPAHVAWGIVPFANNTEVPQAGLRAMSMTMGLLEAKGIHEIRAYKSKESCNQLIVCPNAYPSLQQILSWAREKHRLFIMTGTVNEWTYKVGLDGEPVVSVTLQLYSVKDGRMIWNAVGSKIGTSRSALGSTAQTLIQEMLCSLITV